MKTVKKWNRFSLIELLITIAVIAILAGMLLPALNSAREKAQTILCSSNFKQTGTGIMMYADDNEDQMPNAINSSYQHFTDALMPYCKSRYAARRPLNSAQDFVAPNHYYLRRDSLFVCSTAAATPKNGTVRAEYFTSNYALTRCWGGEGCKGHASAYWRGAGGRKRSQIKGKLLFGEKNFDSTSTVVGAVESSCNGRTINHVKENYAECGGWGVTDPADERAVSNIHAKGLYGNWLRIDGSVSLYRFGSRYMKNASGEYFMGY
ncbi:MAG: type II secretion system protein [bacterium]|nr:type II secretion system protein [bacterium]